MFINQLILSTQFYKSIFLYTSFLQATSLQFHLSLSHHSTHHTHIHKFSLFGLYSQRASVRRDIILSTVTQITLIALSTEELPAISSNESNDLHSKSRSALVARLHVLLSVESWKSQPYFSDLKFFHTDYIIHFTNNVG